MLRRLTVENYALIERLDIEFAVGLNIITGETGAGKSILLGALGLLQGSRGDVSVIKDASKNCVVEGEFDLSGYELERLFEDLDIDYDQTCTIRRVISATGKSRAYVNDIPVQLTSLRDLSSNIIDIHSQHQTLLLGDSAFQVNALDSVASHGAIMESYCVVFAQLSTAQRELVKLKAQAAESSKDHDYALFQLSQLREAKLVNGEQEELETLLHELTHASEIKETLSYACSQLDSDETGILPRLKSLELSVGRLQSFYPHSEEFYTRLHASLLDLKDLASEIASEADRVEASPMQLEKTEQRLDSLYNLQQKHKVTTVAELIDIQEKYEQQLANIEGYTQAIDELTSRIDQLHIEAMRLANIITEQRLKTAPVIEAHVIKTLADLGMSSSSLKIEITPTAELQIHGADSVRFMFSANRNSVLQPIEKVASGGEMSRLMLALKALVATHSQLPTIIFDEIDTGVSGLIADKMGEIIMQLSDVMQIINITHLPQVASKGDNHFLVYKEELGDDTRTFIRKLSADERVDQIAKMLSGQTVTSAALEQANLLLGLK